MSNANQQHNKIMFNECVNESQAIKLS